MKPVHLFPLLLLLNSLFIFSNCKDKKTKDDMPPPIHPSTEVMGYNLLSKISGIWSGPVTSTTLLGSFPEWIVDFRPISAAQVSAKNELDTQNDILMSFFITYHDNAYQLTFRNGGGFAGLQRISYLKIDSVSETSTLSYYRFSDFVKGTGRVYSEVIFKGDSLTLRSFTNKYNSQSTATLHMEWKAKLQDNTSVQDAIVHFDFPEKKLTRDFSKTFEQQTESVYYGLTSDPYPEAEQPYLCKAVLKYTFVPSLTADPSKKVFLIVTTQPLFNGFLFNPTQLKFRSRYVILSASNPQFEFTSMHPGRYFFYAFYDADGNGTFNSGDYVSTANAQFTLGEKGNASATANINFMIP